MPVLELSEGSVVSQRCLGPVSVAKIDTEAIERVAPNEHVICFYPHEAVHSVESWEGKRYGRRLWEVGSVGFIPAGSEIRSIPDRRYVEAAIRFHGSIFERAAAGLVDPARLNLQFTDITDPAVFGFAKSIHAMALVPNIEEWPLLVECGALALATSIIRKLAPPGALPQLNQRNLMCDVRMRRVCDYIEENLSRRIGLQDLADVAVLSQYHFSRQFTEKAGISPLRYVMARRIELAKRELLLPEASIAEVAYACGFSGQSHFTTAFKAGVGLTPGEYRRAHGISLLAA